MKIIVTGSREELTEFIKRLIADKLDTEKKAELPPLLTELAEDEKINELAEAIRSTDEENAPQTEAAEQNTEIRLLHTSADEFKKSLQSISERRALIESMRS